MKTRKNTSAIALTPEQILAIQAILAGASKPKAEPKRKVARKGEITAHAEGFTFTWTYEKMRETGSTQYRLVVADASGRTLTHGNGFPYAVNEADRTLADRVKAGEIKFALGLARNWAKKSA